MNTTSGDNVAKKNYSEEYLSMTVVADGAMLFHINGKDITPELETQLKNLGLNCTTKFKSPCG